MGTGESLHAELQRVVPVQLHHKRDTSMGVSERSGNNPMHCLGLVHLERHNLGHWDRPLCRRILGSFRQREGRNSRAWYYGYKFLELVHPEWRTCLEHSRRSSWESGASEWNQICPDRDLLWLRVAWRFEPDETVVQFGQRRAVAHVLHKVRQIWKPHKRYRRAGQRDLIRLLSQVPVSLLE